MVMPMPAMNADGPLSEEAQGRMRKIKWCVLILIPSVVVEIVTPGLGFMTALRDIFSVIAGIFLLKDEEQFKKAYACLENTPLAMCGRGGGIGCLMPFTFMCGFAGLMAFVTLFQIVFSFSLLLIWPLVVVALTSGTQCMGCYQGWKIFQSLQQGDSFMQNASGGPPQGGVNLLSSSQGGSGGGTGPSFVPFSGTGHTTGTVGPEGV